MPNLKCDSLDRRLISALDESFIIDDSGESASISGLTIKIVRPADDRLELTIEFNNVEFPILMSRTQTLRQLHVAAES